MNMPTYYFPCSPKGWYAGQENSIICTICISGQFGSSTRLDSCENCPRGFFAANTGDHLCENCAEGKFQSQIGSDFCNSCPRGYHSLGEGYRHRCSECPRGYFQATAENTECTICEKGTYHNQKARYIPCKSCVKGMYAASRGRSICLDCPEGYSTNVIETIECTICSDGKFARDAKSLACESCPDGYFAPSTGFSACKSCPRGYFQGLENGNDCLECDTGMYANAVAMSACKACGMGRYSSETGNKASTKCLGCPKGRYGDSNGLSHFSECKMCPAGRYASTTATSGSDACTPCDKGTYGEELGCPGKSTEVTLEVEYDDGTSHMCQKSCVMCGRGKWSATIAATDPATCIACNKGRYQYLFGEFDVTSCIECPKGRYGEQYGLHDKDQRNGILDSKICKACPAGYYLDAKGKESLEDCIACIAGKWLDTTNDLGSTDNIREEDCKPCPAGRYSNIAAAVHDVQDDFNVQTQTGLYEIYCKACSSGKYSEVTGSNSEASCIQCELGKFSPETGGKSDSSCKQCPSGFYGPDPGLQNAKSGLGICRSQLSLPVELTEHVCAADDDCNKLDCYLLPAQTVCEPCPKGKYLNLPGKSAESQCILCPAGKYNDVTGAPSENKDPYDATIGWCKLCPLGFYSDMEGQTSIDTCVSCPLGRTGKQEGTPAFDDCDECPAGWYQDEYAKPEMATTLRTTCKKCTPGRYNRYRKSTSFENNCTKCPAGRYQTRFAKTDVSDCRFCPSGYYSSEIGGVSLVVCIGCPQGRFSDKPGMVNLGIDSTLDADKKCKNCPTGWYQNQIGSLEVTQCKETQRGYFSNGLGVINPSACPRGYFSLAKASTCNQCTEGQYQPKSKQHFCIPANAGNYVPNVASYNEIECPKGKHGRSAYRIDCDDCPRGRFNNVRGIKDSGECLNCAAGRYNDELGLVDASFCKECAPGRFSPQAGNIIDQQCLVCPAGTKQSLSGQSHCIDCITGRYGILEGGTSCSSCLVGRYQNVPASQDCRDCDSGYYQEKSEQELCKLCPGGYFQSEIARIQCIECPLGMYGACDGLNRCLHCPPGQTTYVTASKKCVSKVLATVIPQFLDDEGMYVPDDDPYTICADWFLPETDNEAVLPRIFDSILYQTSYSEDFPLESTNSTELPPNATHACMGVTYPVHIKVVYIRVRGRIKDALGSPSVQTPTYSTAGSCGNFMYLCQRCHKPDGPGAWLIGGSFNPVPDNWICQPCPNGAVCEGPKLWDEVYAKYGYMRLDPMDYDDRKKAFWPCCKTAACLGGKIDLQEGEIPGQKNGWWTGPYDTDPVFIWNVEKCDGDAECLSFVSAYADEEYHDQGVKRRKPIDCCSAIDPLEEDLVSCKKDPENFQAKGSYFGEGALFVSNLQYATTAGDLIDFFLDQGFSPRSASIAYSTISELRPTVTTLGWGTVYFDSNEVAKTVRLTTQAIKGWNLTTGFSPALRGCNIDLGIVDDFEECHVEFGHRLNCSRSNSVTGKCRLCRACANGYWAQGVSSCYQCPHWILNIVLVILAVSFVLLMLMMFLSTALQDSGAESDSTVAHFSQAAQKILLNHVQLISLGSGFPLKWPEEIQNMFEVFSIFGNAGSYVFNPACNGMELVEGASMFFQKQLGILLLPFIAASICAIFWVLSHLYEKRYPYEKRRKRKEDKLLRKKEKAMLKIRKRFERKAAKQKRYRERHDTRIHNARAAHSSTGNAWTTARVKDTHLQISADSKEDSQKSAEATMKEKKKHRKKKRIKKKKKTSRSTKIKVVHPQEDFSLKSKGLDKRKSRLWSETLKLDDEGFESKKKKKPYVEEVFVNGKRTAVKVGNEYVRNKAAIKETFAEKHDVLKQKHIHLDEPKEESDKRRLARVSAFRSKLHGKELWKDDWDVDGNDEPVKVLTLTVFPSAPHGIEWAPTEKMKNSTSKNSKPNLSMDIKGSLSHKYVAKIKNVSSPNTLAGLAGLEPNDILRSVNGHPVVGITYAHFLDMIKSANFIGEPYQCVFIRKMHIMRERINYEVRNQMDANRNSITTFDKFSATMITTLYLMYPTITRATFQLVACQAVGSRFYLQMDLDIPCYEEEHMVWLINLFVPSLLCYVVGMPLATLFILVKNRNNLTDRLIRFRYSVLFSGYAESCFYWEVVIALRKALVITVSVFLTTAGAESQALCAMMIIMASTVAHMIFKPFDPINEEHNTLYWAEFLGLQTAFLTFWTGLFFYQEVAQIKWLQVGFTFELLTVNFVFLAIALRWYFILKLMDLGDLLATKQLQGFSKDELSSDLAMQSILMRLFPNWQLVNNLWARRAWQQKARDTILEARLLENIGGLEHLHRDHRFALGTTAKLHKNAIKRLGLSVIENSDHEAKSESRKRGKKKELKSYKATMRSKMAQKLSDSAFLSSQKREAQVRARKDLESYLPRPLYEEDSKEKQKNNRNLINVTPPNTKNRKSRGFKLFGSRRMMKKLKDEASVQSITSQHERSSSHLKRRMSGNHIDSKKRLKARLEARKKAKSSNALQSCKIFESVKKGYRNRIIDAMELSSVPVGTVICKEGDDADRLYLIVSGSCVVTKESFGGERIAVINELSVFGEASLALYTGKSPKRSATVTADSAGSNSNFAEGSVVLLSITTEKFSSLVESGALGPKCVEALKEMAVTNEKNEATQREIWTARTMILKQNAKLNVILRKLEVPGNPGALSVDHIKKYFTTDIKLKNSDEVVRSIFKARQPDASAGNSTSEESISLKKTIDKHVFLKWLRKDDKDEYRTSGELNSEKQLVDSTICLASPKLENEILQDAGKQLSSTQRIKDSAGISTKIEEVVKIEKAPNEVSKAAELHMKKARPAPPKSGSRLKRDDPPSFEQQSPSANMNGIKMNNFAEYKQEGNKMKNNNNNIIKEEKTKIKKEDMDKKEKKEESQMKVKKEKKEKKEESQMKVKKEKKEKKEKKVQLEKEEKEKKETQRKKVEEEKKVQMVKEAQEAKEKKENKKEGEMGKKRKTEGKGNKVMDVDAVRALLSTKVKISKSTSKLKKIFKKLDKDKDGHLNIREFAILIRQLTKQKCPKLIKECYKAAIACKSEASDGIDCDMLYLFITGAHEKGSI